MTSSDLPAPGNSSDQTAADNNLRRLLLYEVLLEEYESHCPFREEVRNEQGADEWSRLAESEVILAHEEATTQPALSKGDVEEILAKAEKYKLEQERASDLNIRAELEDEHHGKLVSSLLTFIVKAQKKASEHKFGVLWDKYDKKLDQYVPNSKSLSKDLRTRMVEKLVIADIHGVVDDYREKYRRDQIETDGLDKREDREKLDPLAEQFACRTVIKEEPSAAANRDPTTTDEENLRSTLSKRVDAVEQPKADGPRLDDAIPRKPSKLGESLEVEPQKEVNHGLKARRLDASTRRSALCLSGGGIRSATFNLGILQGLARHGMLGQFDYLSTVSGGGFAGGFLTAWLHRAGTKEVLKKLTDPPGSPLVTEPPPIDHLRVFGNYLSLRPGLLSADTWTLIATVLRNLLLTWFVFVPFLLIMLMAPRVWATLLATEFRPTRDLYTVLIFFVPGIVFGWISLSYTTYSLSKQHSPIPRSARDYKSNEGPFLWFCLAPAILSAMAFAAGWVRLTPAAQGRTTWWYFITLMVVLVGPIWMGGYLIVLYQQISQQGDQSKPQPSVGIINKLIAGATHHTREIFRFLFRWILILLSQFIAGLLLYVVAKNLLPSYQAHPRLFATFAVPLLLLNMALACTLIAGFNSGFTRDDDQEWWARFSAWFLIVVVGWSAAHLLVLYGPSFILSLVYLFAQFQQKGVWDEKLLETAAKVIAVLTGIVSGVITLSGGFSPKSPANNDKAASAGVGGQMLDKLTSAVAPIFLAFLIILLAIVTDALLTSRLADWMMQSVFSYPDNYRHAFLITFPSDHAGLVRLTPLRLLIVIGILIAIVGTVMGLLINSNTFSLHYMWRNRIIRAYLGASRRKRRPDNFTGFDVDDNIHMHELRPPPKGVALLDLDRPESEKRPKGVECPKKLFHIVNVALNLAGGDKLAWQDRKAESFTISPLHVGSYWLGYRRSVVYGGERGISLGTSVAISGAFVSPNMGYMMTSPIVRFLMTLFNVRFGWWLGNPGAAGDKTYWTERIVAAFRNVFFSKQSGKPFELKSPLLSVKPIVQEAFGKTNDKAPYVYLSDGGHFENLGLYEMVLRRCRFIVVSDASSDAGYSFDSLAQSIRQIRVDLGIPIDIQEMSIIPPSQDLRGKYCAIGKIRYSCVDWKRGSGLHQEDFDGILVYIKASMIGNEPRDVINYEQSSNDFPQEIIVDQWFSESQFESYRALGSHIIDAICGDDQNRISLAAFGRKVKEHNRVNFRVFKDQISLAALEDQFKRAMLENTPQVYKEKVQEYLKDLLDLK